MQMTHDKDSILIVLNLDLGYCTRSSVDKTRVNRMKSMEPLIMYISGKSAPLIFKYLLQPRTAEQVTKIQLVTCSLMLLFFFYSHHSKITHLKRKL